MMFVSSIADQPISVEFKMILFKMCKNVVPQGWRGKSKSSHDMTNDPKLSAVPAVDAAKKEADKRRASSPDREVHLYTH